MPVSVRRFGWTVDELDALEDDGQRYEIIDGELFVTPTPRDTHQLVVGEFYVRLHACTRTAKRGKAVGFPSDIRRGDYSRNRVQPDAFVMKLIDGRRPDYPYALRDLALVIEVVSPSSIRLDTEIKRELYLREGVGEYWIVDPDARTVLRWLPGDATGTLLSDHISWQLEGMGDALKLDLPALFAEALD